MKIRSAVGVRALEDIHAWGHSRAATIEGPDRMAIEIVGVEQP
jgi:hypothetical protein